MTKYRIWISCAAFMMGGGFLIPKGLAQEAGKVYRIKRSGESAALPVARPQKTTQETPTPSPSDSDSSSRMIAVPASPSREKAVYYQWNQGDRRTVKRHEKLIQPANYLDHSVFDGILRKYIDKHGWVNYRRLKRDKHAMADLKAYVEDLSALNPSTLEDPADRLAAWLNLYNALVLQEILKHYPVKNALQIPDFYGKRRFVIGDKNWSLLEIEEKIFRQEIREPRAVLARVTSASGAPRFMQEAFSASRIEEQLEDRTWKFLLNRNNVDYNPKTRTLILSSLFLWYQKEFGDTILFLRTYLDKLPKLFNVGYRGFDWTLNDEKLH
jgi:hypothetical protein